MGVTWDTSFGRWKRVFPHVTFLLFPNFKALRKQEGRYCYRGLERAERLPYVTQHFMVMPGLDTDSFLGLLVRPILVYSLGQYPGAKVRSGL